MADTQRIKFAYYDASWQADAGDPATLRSQAQSVVAVDVTNEMEGHLFCPECCTNVTKSPKTRQRFKNGRKACFVHWPSYQHIKCPLRSTKPEGMRFATEEAAAQALDRGDLVLVNQFMRQQPQPPESSGHLPANTSRRRSRAASQLPDSAPSRSDVPLANAYLVGTDAVPAP